MDEGGKKMKAILRKFSVFIMVLFGVIALSQPVFAESITVSIPVTLQIDGTISSSEKFTFELKSIDNAPLPENTIVEIEKNGTVSFGDITYDIPGIYDYQVMQKSGSTKNIKYDNTTYYVTVSVVNGDNGELESVVAVHTDAEKKSKKADIVFKNVIEKIPSKSTSVNTSDSYQPLLWAGVIVVALDVVVFVVTKRKQS